MQDPLEGCSELPTLTTEGYTLRAFTRADRPALFAMFSDREVTRYWGHDAFTDLTDADRWLDEVEQGFAGRTMLEWAVTEDREGPLAGTCALTNWDREHRRAELGFALRRDRWGRGIMTEVLPELIRFGFETLNLHRIEADVDPRNVPSIRHLERLGFRYEGLLRERYIINGEAQDAAMYGLLRSEFDERTASR